MEMLTLHAKPHQSLHSFPLVQKIKKPAIIMSLRISPQNRRLLCVSNGGYSTTKLQQPWRPNGQLARVSSSETKCCRSSGAISELEDGNDEIALGEELVQLQGKLKEKCKETNGIAELLECLEREAIMGEDEGKEPTDYNRRAQIFDKSARFFQALKERNMGSTKEDF